MSSRLFTPLLLALCACGCGGDDESPLTPLEKIIAAAREGDPSGLADLCDPDGTVDSDARRICEASPDDARAWDLFRAWFAHARIGGFVPRPGDPDELARVSIVFGPDERRAEVTLVRRGARWYLREL